MTTALPPDGCGLDHHDLAGIDGDSAPLPSILWRADGAGLLYRETINTLSGEPGCGKTWLALEAVAELLNAGEPVIVIDYEDGPRTTRDRLLSIGVGADDMAQLCYLQAAGPIGKAGVAWLVEEAASTALVVIDSVPEALGAAGLSEDSAGDVAAWTAALPRRLARAGAGVLLIDHVAKAEKDRGRWPRGSGHKLAAVDGVAYSINVEVPFSRSSSGWAELIIAKDRRGWIGPARSTAAVVRFDVSDGSLVAVRCEASDGAAPAAKPRRLTAEDVALALRADGGEWSSLRTASESLGCSPLQTGQALRRAKDAGLVEEAAGAGSARRFVLPGHDSESSSEALW